MISVTVMVNSVSVMPVVCSMCVVLRFCLTWLATEELPPPLPPVFKEGGELEAMTAVENRPVNNIRDRAVEVRLLLRMSVTVILGNQAFPGMPKRFRHFHKQLLSSDST